MKQRTRRTPSFRHTLSLAAATWFALPAYTVWADNAVQEENSVYTADIHVDADAVKEEAKYESQSTTIITAEDIARKQAKSVEDVIFNEVGVTRTIDAMGNVGVSIRGADPRHTLILVDGQRVLGGEAKYNGSGDELLRIGAENIERIEIIRGAASAKYGADAIGGVIRVITKQGVKNPSVSLNIEERYHRSRAGSGTETNTLPANFYLRADAGDMGKLNLSGWTSKREVMPVYSHGKQFVMGENWYEDFKPSLRFYGSIKNDGVSGSYKFDDANKLSFRFTAERENMQRRNKGELYPLGSFFEPMQIYQRDRRRDTYSLSYEGRIGKNTDFTLNYGYGKLREDDSTLLTYYSSGRDKYSGKNSLAGVDYLDHTQTNIDLHFNTAVNDAHYLSYGFGWQREYAAGSRLRNAPKSYTKKINPWDYDKSLDVDDNTAGVDDEPSSYVHNYKFIRNENGFVWDRNGEYYGAETPPMTYEEVQRVLPEIFGGGIVDPAMQAKYDAFEALLKAQNDFSDAKFDNTPMMYKHAPVLGYYGALAQFGPAYKQDKNITFNGAYYGQGFAARQNQLLLGEADLTKTYAYVQDSWQVTPKTILTPILRIDHSNRFGSHATLNLGMTHMLAKHRRLKANIGTGYGEPGLGELFYNWEMYGGTGADHLGWYWIGNPNLKPEKSLNIDLALEGENERTYGKVGIFHNEISDYMTHYFTGQLVDFNFHGRSFRNVPDRIYSFRNIGKAKLTGIEAEVQHKFDKHWSAKLGYTYLHAINASDDDLPRRLLDRPTHKFDVGVNYKDEAHGWRAAFWGSFFSRMLDSNSVKTDNLFEKDGAGNYIRKRGEYREKSFGIWNLLVEKDIRKDFTVYAGIDNLFNHQDDDRAYHDRMFRFGVNMKFDEFGSFLDTGIHRNEDGVLVDRDGVPLKNFYGDDFFLRRPETATDGRAKGSLDFFGDYRMRTSAYRGYDRTEMRETKETQADADAARNYADRPGHGFGQRLRIGADYRIDNKLGVKAVLATGEANDAADPVDETKGLGGVHVERAEVTGSPGRWDWTLGRIHEPMGVTGYFFGKEYDGVRVLYTKDRTQVAAGFGDFSRTTGVYTSAYSHKEAAIIRRAPTLNELFGYYTQEVRDANNQTQHVSSSPYPMNYDPNAPANFREKYNNAGKIQDADGNWVRDPALSDVQIAEKKLDVMREFVSILKSVDAELVRRSNETPGGGGYESKWEKILDGDGAPDTATSTFYSNFYSARVVVRRSDGVVRDLYRDNNYAALKYLDLSQESGVGSPVDNPKYGGVEGMLHEQNIRTMMDDILKEVEDAGSTYETENGQSLTRAQAIDRMFSDFVGETAEYFDQNIPGNYGGSIGRYNGVSKFFSAMMGNERFNPLNNAPIPLPGAPIAFRQPGFLLKHDVIPKIERAGFLKVRHQFGKRLGAELWTLRSFGHGMDVKGERLPIANVIGIGARAVLGPRTMFSFDYGINRAATGRYFHGGRDIYGRYTGGGSVPYFWVMRLDFGIPDMDIPGSWGVYLDYKNFEHGAFLGGTGADLPDRYLDGIRSFTAGLAFVPAQNLMLEATYTFGARSTQMRDTLYTPENFRLGDYTRIQLTYRF